MPGAERSLGCELLIAKFRLRLKKVGKTTRPFRYDLNQIPYGYTGEVTNRFKGLDLIECLINYGWKVHDTVQEAVIKIIPKKKKCKRLLRKPYKYMRKEKKLNAKEKRKDTPI